MNQQLLQLKPYPMEELNRRKQELHRQGVRIFDFGTGDPTLPTEPFIIDALRDAIPRVSQYPTVMGEPALLDACTSSLWRRFGVVLSVEQILPTAGSKEAVFHFPQVFLNVDSSKRHVIYPTPGYPVYERGTLFAQGTPWPVVLTEENGFQIDFSTLPESVLQQTAIVWINSPHNPTGAVASGAYFEEILAYARKYDFIVCSDECYCDIYTHEPPASILQHATEGVLAFFSLSKRSGMTGYRSGFVAGDSSLIAKYRKFRASMGVASPVFIQAAATAAWSDDAHVQRRRLIFLERRRLFEQFFAEHGLHCASGPGTFFLWVRVPAGYDGESYARLLLEQGIVVSPGSFYGEGSEAYIRLAMVPDLEECQEALSIWKTIL